MYKPFSLLWNFLIVQETVGELLAASEDQRFEHEYCNFVKVGYFSIHFYGY